VSGPESGPAMRVIGFLVRVGLVIAVLAGLLALVDDGSPDRATGAPPARAVQRTRTTPAARPVPKGTFTFSAVGDVMMGSTPDLPPDGGASYFSRVASAIRADVALANLEGTLSTGGSSKCGGGSTNCFAFQTPPSYARWLRLAGFTILNLANNHAADYGSIGERQTLAALARQRLRHTGRPGEIAVLKVHGIRVALIGFAPYPWAQSLTNVAAAKRLVARAGKRADVVVVTMHAGGEGVAFEHVRPGTETFLGENRGNPLVFSHAVIDAGADLVVGSGPHVLRGIEWYRGRLIVYSLGNFGGYGRFVLSGPLATTAILRVELRGSGAILAARLVAARLIGAGVPVLDPSGAAYALVRSLSRADFGSAGATVSATGRVGHA
jgi:poly-gamma-glutamate capsule biosynthesis protein CapA/YwtB (metallophosphatase superfamily)